MKRLATLLSRAALACLAALLFQQCRKIELVMPTEYDILPVEADPAADPVGLWLLNEGNMGSNKASLDFLDFRTALYARNVYAEKNPHTVKELGDVGNDIRIYRGLLYAVINCSHKVEVMDAATGVRVTQIDIPNCRYICFRDDFAYVTSYVGPVQIDPNAPKGAVYKINLRNHTIVDKVTVGYQPDELVIVGDRLYVANSGGYRTPDYDNTVSVVELSRFRQIAQIPVAINLHRIRADRYGRLWVSSRGNYKDVGSNLYLLEPDPGAQGGYSVTRAMDIPCSNLAIAGDSLYLYSVEFSYETNRNEVTYGVIDLRTTRITGRSFVADGTQDDIKIPYGIAVHPSTGDIYVTDARNYVSSGVLHCYGPDGMRKWSVRTGDIPAHMVFLRKSDLQ